MSITVTSKDENTIQLYSHQVDSVVKIEELYRTGMITQKRFRDDSEINYTVESSVFILADQPGYGKTLTACAFLSRNLLKVGEEHICFLPYKKKYARDNVCITRTEKRKTIPQAVIICDKKLINQWEKELDSVGISYVTYDVPKSVRNPDSIYDDLFDEDDNINTQVVIVSAHIFYLFLSNTSGFVYNMLIFDEYVHIQLEKCSKIDNIDVNFTLLISGTSYGYFEFKSTLNFFHTNIINVNLLRNDHKRSFISIDHPKEILDQSIILPVPIHREYKYIPNQIVHRFSNYISSEARHSLINGDIEHAFSILGVRTGQSLKEVLIAKLKQKIDNNAEAISICQSEELKNRLLEKAESLNKQLEDLENNVLDEEDLCPICFDDFTQGSVTITKCEHKFHAVCIGEMIAHDNINMFNCPSCRTPNNMSDLIYCDVHEDEEDEQDEEDEEDEQDEQDEPKNQKETTKKIIRNLLRDPDKKILVYCQYDTKRSFYHALQDYSDQICFVGGTRKQMDKQIKNFKEGNTRILFMKSTKDASGLHLPETTDIIIMHAVPDDVKEQIIARSVRIGVTHQTTIHQLSAIEYGN
jgi:uncharacterized Zn finger protein (UPF0148 family)